MSSIPYIRQGALNVRMPNGTGYIHPNAANWGALPSDNLQDGDEVFVEFLGISTSYGIAKWSQLAEDWELQEVSFGGWDPNDFSDVFLTIGTIANKAIIRTDDGSQEAPIYFWNSTGSEWVRSPEDVAYTWSPASLTNWAGLGALEGILAGDRAEVGIWTTGGTAGVARYDGTNWKLVEGVVDTIANLVAFSYLKETGAKVTVGTGIAADPVYFWSGSVWVRTAHQSHYIWPQINYWSDLTSLRPHAINDDEVHLNSLGTPHSNGTAQKHGSTWKLIEGKWTSVSEMNSWSPTDIHSGAIAFIDPNHQYDEDSTVYYRSGSNWVRMANNVPVTFVISSLQDFSGLGLKDGDYGVYTPSGGAPIVMRYKAACDIATAAGGGTTPMWLPPQVYAGSPQIRSYIVGTEATDGAITGRNWTIARTGGGTVGTVAGGYMRLYGPSNPAGSSGTLTGPTFTGVTKFYLIGEFRGAAAGSDPYCGIFGNAQATPTVIPAQYALGTGNNSFIIRQKTMPSAAWANADTSSQIMSGGLTWNETTPYLVQALSGAAISDLIETRFNGELYSSFRRDFDTAADASSYALLLIANGGGGGTTSWLEFKNLYFVTY